MHSLEWKFITGSSDTYCKDIVLYIYVRCWEKNETCAIVLYFLILGVIRMASQMDRETKDQYLVIIQAKDMVGQPGAFSATATVTINLSDVNDNPPKFQQRK